jgi:hypothetical protein
MTTTDTPLADAAFGDNLVKCYCPRCIVGVHDDIQLAAQYRKHTEWRERAEKAEAEVERLNQEVTKGARILATIVDALEQAAPWIKATLNTTDK